MLRLIKQSTQLLSATLASRVFSFFANIFAARTLDLNNFGLLMFVRGTIAMVEAIFINPLGDTTIRKMVAQKKLRKRTAWTYMLITLLIGMIMAPIILGLTLWTPTTSDLLLSNDATSFAAISALVVLSIGVLCSTALLKVVVGYDLLRPLSLLSVSASFVFCLFVFVHSSNMDLISFLQVIAAFYVVDTLLKVGLLFFCERNSRTFQPNGEKKTPAIKDYGVLYLLIASAATALLFWGARYELAFGAGGLEQLGLFDAALHIFTLIMLLTGAMTTIALRNFSENPEATRVQLQSNIKLVVITTVPMCLVLGIFSSEVMSIFGASFVQGSHLVWLVGTISIFASLASLFDKLQISRKNERAVLFSTLGASLVTLVFVSTQGDRLIPNTLAAVYTAFYVSKFSLLLFPSYRFWRKA